jgi:Na+/phosphate symporter
MRQGLKRNSELVRRFTAGWTRYRPARAPAVRIRLDKILLFSASLFLFMLAITLMKDGARALAPLLTQSALVANVPNSLGLGWLFTYLLMSGSPVAATALTFLDAGALDATGAFAMISGSRLGASFIVLFVGFVYVMRGRDRATSLSMGLLSYLVTATTCGISFFLGLFLLHQGVFDGIYLGSGVLLNSMMALIFDPLSQLLLMLLPRWLLFPLGTAIIIVSFSLFDRCLPQMSVKESQVGQVSRVVYRPLVMFLLGTLVTLISMSVSVSLSLLVPLSDRGFIRRENVIPYIMGANISTFIDTLLAAVLLENSLSFTVVWIQMVSIAAVSTLILITMYRRYEGAMLAAVAWVTARNRNLLIFMVAIFALPIILLLV